MVRGLSVFRDFAPHPQPLSRTHPGNRTAPFARAVLSFCTSRSRRRHSLENRAGGPYASATNAHPPGHRPAPEPTALHHAAAAERRRPNRMRPDFVRARSWAGSHRLSPRIRSRRRCSHHRTSRSQTVKGRRQAAAPACPSDAGPSSQFYSSRTAQSARPARRRGREATGSGRRTPCSRPLLTPSRSSTS